jgi:hypothetical protein
VDELETVTFQPWPTPDTDVFGEGVDGTYSRLVWLPTVGPSSWLIWGTVAAQLHRDPAVTWQAGDLAVAHGLSAGTGRHSQIVRTLDRLARFRLLLPEEDVTFVRLTAPPALERHLARLPSFARHLHEQTFSASRLHLAG